MPETEELTFTAAERAELEATEKFAAACDAVEDAIKKRDAGALVAAATFIAGRLWAYAASNRKPVRFQTVAGRRLVRRGRLRRSRRRTLRRLLGHA